MATSFIVMSESGAFFHPKEEKRPRLTSTL
jgi:hypothetical protein